MSCHEATHARALFYRHLLSLCAPDEVGPCIRSFFSLRGWTDQVNAIRKNEIIKSHSICESAGDRGSLSKPNTEYVKEKCHALYNESLTAGSDHVSVSQRCYWIMDQQFPFFIASGYPEVVSPKKRKRLTPYDIDIGRTLCACHADLTPIRTVV